jgi:hypothetical protein
MISAPADLLHALWMIGAGITTLLGLMGLVSPVAVARLTGLGLPDALARSEVRATYGGFFLALGLVALASDERWVYLTLGLGWIGAAVGRLVSVIADGSRSPKNLAGVAFEAAIGALLVIG